MDFFTLQNYICAKIKQMGNLVIYRASAGSGKTFTLAVSYIKLLIQNPRNYRHILAVTFTNKATAEMKQRILSQLYGIGHGLPQSDDYLQKIQQELRLDVATIRQNALQALHLILHDFSFFHVETIDSFFQTVMRSLAHELQLSNNLMVDLDVHTAIEEAVDNMMEQLLPGSPEIQWILETVGDQLDNNRKWDISGPLKSFATHLFDEPYQQVDQHMDELLSNQFTHQYKQDLQNLRDSVLEKLQDYAATFYDSLEENGYTIDDFSYKSGGGISFFHKIRNGMIAEEDLAGQRIQSFLTDEKAWSGGPMKKDPRLGDFMACVRNIWKPLMEFCYQEVAAINIKINTCNLLLKNLNELRLLNVIHSFMNENNRKNNHFLLADTNKLLHRLIQDTDAPFIFEKLGTQLHHIMIDEFQDTSRMQWTNFRSLLVECLSATEGDSLVVGDIKQSIYRWRNGDWGILANMDQEDLHGGIRIEDLDTNYRSMGNIIQFNDEFFQKLQERLVAMGTQEGLDVAQITKAYQGVENQQMRPSVAGLGHIDIRLINTTGMKAAADGISEYDQQTLDQLAAWILELTNDKHVNSSEIAILVRAKSANIPKIANYFGKNYPTIQLVSDEAYQLQASTAVSFITYVLAYIQTPLDKLSLVLLTDSYVNGILQKQVPLATITQQLVASPETVLSYLPNDFIQQLGQLKLLPLYELVERIIHVFQLSTITGQTAYLFTFLDELGKYTQEKPSDITSFLTYWSETLCHVHIPAGKVEGVRIMSIHKSKGLEFNHVAVPFCDFDLASMGRDTVWCQPKTEPYNHLPLAPIQFCKAMKDSEFRQEYTHELLQQWIDNMNLLYVAFTRPKCNLLVIGKLKPSKDGMPDNTVSHLIFHVLGGKDADYREDNFNWQMGSFYLPQQKKKEVRNNPFECQPQDYSQLMVSTQPQLIFHQSNKSADFLQAVQEEAQVQDAQQFYLSQGLKLHSLFSKIRTVHDVDKCLEELLQNGEVNNKQIKQLRKYIERGFHNNQVADWFSDKWQIYNECNILCLVDGQLQVRRPDRVLIDGEQVIVIDFKFGTPKPEYREQVQQYVQLMRQMGYSQIEGYLWYVYSNKVEKV